MIRTQKSFYLLLLSILLPFLYSCEDDSTEPVIDSLYENGILVVNQGNFGQGNGSLDYYSYGQEGLMRNVYEKENEEPVGGIIQNIAFHNERMYIVSNNSDKIIVADGGSLQMLNTVEGLTTPRYISFHGNKAYVSVWGPYTADWTLESSEVAVIDLNNHSIIKRIPVAAGPEGIITIGNKVFVANSESNIITVIDANTDEIIEEIETEARPAHLLEDNNGHLWVSYSSGFIMQFNPDNYQAVKKIEIEGNAAPQGRMALHENDLYFRLSQALEYPETSDAIYRVSTTGDAFPQLVMEKGNMYTFSVDPANGDILAGIAAGADPGTIVRFDNEGNEQDNFAAGVFPHEIIFRQ